MDLTPQQTYEFSKRLLIASGNENDAAKAWILANRRKRTHSVEFCILKMKAILGERFRTLALEILSQMKTEGVI